MQSLDIGTPGSGYEVDELEDGFPIEEGFPEPDIYGDFLYSQTERLETAVWWHLSTTLAGRRWSSPRRVLRTRPCRTDAEVDAMFEELKEDWKARTAAQSAMSRFMDPAYQRIIGLGLQVLPKLFDELSREPSPQWFWALNAIVGQDQAIGCTTVQDAIDAWMAWADAEGYTS
jgi:hypothetical protein